jgi:undecaprenyl-diphosphatase
MNELYAFILGIVEGLTEFLPVSSTGHLILASKLLHIGQGDFEKSFEIIIQLGAILSVIIIYFEKLIKDYETLKKILIAFVPSGLLGFTFYKIIKNVLFNYFIVSISLIIWGVIFLIVEYYLRNRKVFNNNISYTKAFIIGLFQSFALIPGTSRSGATIVGGLVLGLSRKSAVEFSFLLSIPTMVIATGYDLLKNYHSFNNAEFHLLLIGFITSFVFAYISVKWLLNFISNHNFIPFAIYRIILGLVFVYLNL